MWTNRGSQIKNKGAGTEQASDGFIVKWETEDLSYSAKLYNGAYYKTSKYTAT